MSRNVRKPVVADEPLIAKIIAGILVGLFVIALVVGAFALQVWLIMLIVGALGYAVGFFKVALIMLLVNFALSALGTVGRH
ncbi:membrane protein [Gordonia phage Octobien14]|uniref:Membrane protein n=1 Tax=Gordonia phage Octobien14 TaxID=2483673 RepID=A0A3G3M9R6_9CAUD|nr:membrane protein [Gordonia phage Octobien14]AYR03250.1 membrane protein [Gordonia phage Octobien14]